MDDDVTHKLKCKGDGYLIQFGILQVYHGSLDLEWKLCSPLVVRTLCSLSAFNKKSY